MSDVRYQMSDLCVTIREYRKERKGGKERKEFESTNLTSDI